MRTQNLIAMFTIICIALLLSACSSSSPVTPVTPASQEQTPVETTPVPEQVQPSTPEPSISTNSSTTVTQPEPTPVEPAPVETTPVVVGVTASELALHNSKTDCWVVYKNTTYDVTKYLPKHPGGTLAISKHCGTLGFEKMFRGQHGTSKEKTLASNAINMGEYIG